MKTFVKVELLNKYHVDIPVVAARAIQNPDPAATVSYGRWWHALGKELSRQWCPGSDIVYTSGLNSAQLGAVIDDAQRRLPRGRIYWVDSSRWDGHYGVQLSPAVAAHYAKYGAPRYLLRDEARLETTMLDPTTGLKLKTLFIRESGRGQTSCGNSPANAYLTLRALSMAEPLPPAGVTRFVLLVLGDDQLLFVAEDHPLTEQQLHAAYVEGGMKPKTGTTQNVLRAEFCSGRFYLTAEGNRVWAPKVGRALAKMGWQLHPNLRPDEWLAATAASWRQDVNHVPILRAAAKRMTQWAAGQTRRHIDRRPHSPRHYSCSVEALNEFCALYGLAPNDVAAAEEYLLTLPRGAQVDHWVIDKVCAFDIEEPDGTSAAALSLAPLPPEYRDGHHATWIPDFSAYSDSWQQYLRERRRHYQHAIRRILDLICSNSFRALGLLTAGDASLGESKLPKSGTATDTMQNEPRVKVTLTEEKAKSRKPRRNGKPGAKPRAKSAAKPKAEPKVTVTVGADTKPVAPGGSRRGRNPRHPSFAGEQPNDVADLLDMFALPGLAAPQRYSDKAARPTVVAVPYTNEPMLPCVENSSGQSSRDLTDTDWMCGFVFRDPRRAAVVKQRPNGQFIYAAYYGQAVPTMTMPAAARLVGSNIVPDIMVSAGGFAAHGPFLAVGRSDLAPGTGAVVWVDSPRLAGVETKLVWTGLTASTAYTWRVTRFLNGITDTFDLTGTSDGAGALSVNFPVGKPGYMAIVNSSIIPTTATWSIQGDCETWSHRMLPYLNMEAGSIESLRVLAADIMYSNTAPQMYRSGVAATYQASGDDDWTRYAFGGPPSAAFGPGVNGMGTILSCKGSQRFETTEGVHNWVRPTGFDSFQTINVGQRSTGLAIGRVPEPYDIDSDYDYTMVAYLIPQTDTQPSGRAGYWTFNWAVEYETESPWRDQEMPSIHPSAWAEAVFQSRLVVGGTTNSRHIKDILRVVSAITRVVPHPAARTVGTLIDRFV